MKRKDNVFSDVAPPRVEKSKFDFSHDKKFTFRMGNLVPVCCMEALPGDKFSLSYVNMLRMMPMIAPVMHKVRLKTDYFFVPNRILFEGWEGFITGTEVVEAPYIRLTGIVEKGSVADYLGVPPGDYNETPINVNALQFAAYQRIFDDWYRDQNLVAEVTPAGGLQPGSNPGLVSDFTQRSAILSPAWEHDYFTSALPFSQQGTEVDIPLTFQNDIPVELNTALGVQRFENAAGAGFVSGDLGTNASGNLENLPSTTPGWIDPGGSLTVDVQSDAASINDLREAFSLQAFLERSIRGGLRYFEQIWAHFRKASPDSRLQRPELIGRATQMVTISEVLATAQSTGDGIAVGSMAGHGISVGGNDSLFYECEEHGFIFGLISVIPDTAYQDGLHRSFSRFDRLDYMWPSFAHLGEQPIFNRELMVHDIPTGGYDPDGIFGYIPRYSEYRYMPSQVAGEFRDTLAFWHLGRQFDPLDGPTLSDAFVTADPRDDIFAVTTETEDHIVAQVINVHHVVRSLPRYGVPSTLG